MKPTKESYETAVKFAKTIDCDIVKYGCQYGEWLAYFVSAKDLMDSFCGYPIVVFVRSDMKCRLADIEEVNKVMSICSETKKITAHQNQCYIVLKTLTTHL